MKRLLESEAYPRPVLSGYLVNGGAIESVLLANDMEGEHTLSQPSENVIVFKGWALEVAHQETVDAGALDLGSVGIKLAIAVQKALFMVALSRCTSFPGALFL